MTALELRSSEDPVTKTEKLAVRIRANSKMKMDGWIPFRKNETIYEVSKFNKKVSYNLLLYRRFTLYHKARFENFYFYSATT